MKNGTQIAKLKACFYSTHEVLQGIEPSISCLQDRCVNQQRPSASILRWDVLWP